MYNLDKSDRKSINNVKFIHDAFKNTSLVNSKIDELIKLRIIHGCMYYMFAIAIPRKSSYFLLSYLGIF